VNVSHSTKLSTLSRIGRDDWNDWIMTDNRPMGIIPYERYQRNMQSVIDQRDDKGISPFVRHSLSS
jgi:hypothetical protein